MYPAFLLLSAAAAAESAPLPTPPDSIPEPPQPPFPDVIPEPPNQARLDAIAKRQRRNAKRLSRTAPLSGAAARYQASLPPHELVQSAYLAVRDRAVRYRHGMGPGARWPSLQQVRRTLRRAGLRLRRRGRGGP